MAEFTSLAICTLITSWTLTSLAFFSIGLTIVVNIYQLRRFGSDDSLIFVSFVLSVVLVALSTWSIVDEGQGMHQQDISSTQLERMAKSLLVAEALWSLINGLIRISACLFLQRIFGVLARYSYFLYVLMAISALLGVASLLQVLLICRPFAANWDQDVLGACGDQLTSFMVIESIGLALDLVILAVPAHGLMKMNITLRRRLGIIVLLDSGIVVLVITALRMHSLYDAVSPDFSYSQSHLSLLSAAGTMTSIICCASPTVRRAWILITEGRQSKKEQHNDVEKAAGGLKASQASPNHIQLSRKDLHPLQPGQANTTEDDAKDTKTANIGTRQSPPQSGPLEIENQGRIILSTANIIASDTVDTTKAMVSSSRLSEDLGMQAVEPLELL